MAGLPRATEFSRDRLQKHSVSIRLLRVFARANSPLVISSSPSASASGLNLVVFIAAPPYKFPSRCLTEPFSISALVTLLARELLGDLKLFFLLARLNREFLLEGARVPMGEYVD